MGLIDADKLTKRFKQLKGVDSLANMFITDVVKEIQGQPTVEAVPVVHGEWIYNENYTWECGNCGFLPFKGYIPEEPGFNFCPNCGADMRKKV